jgi:hypothetical protein
LKEGICNITRVWKLLGGNGGEYDEEYEYEEEDDFPELLEGYYNIMKKLKELCERYEIIWNLRLAIEKYVDPDFNDLVTIARESVLCSDFVSNRQFFMIFNSRLFIVQEDWEDDAEGFKVFMGC